MISPFCALDFFFEAPPEGIATCELAPGLNLIGSGGYVIGFGSWLANAPKGALDTSWVPVPGGGCIGEMSQPPRLPDYLIELVKQVSPRPQLPVGRNGVDFTSSWKELEEIAASCVLGESASWRERRHRLPYSESVSAGEAVPLEDGMAEIFQTGYPRAKPASATVTPQGNSNFYNPWAEQSGPGEARIGNCYPAR